MLDPRLSIIENRLSSVERIIVVSSGKGGVGKSIIASTLALILAREGFKVGLLDLDLTSPTTHVALGISAERVQPTEDRGIVPPEFHGIKYMSLIFYLGDKAAPLRGSEISNALLEVLAITRWGKLDFLLVDMPPGIGDLMLDVLKYLRRAHFLIITSSSKMAFETVRKLLLLLRGLGAKIVGVVENMKADGSTYIRREVNALGEKFLGEIHLDENLEDAIGNVEKLLKTKFAYEIRENILGGIKAIESKGL